MTTAVRRYSRGRKLVAMRDVQAGQSRYYHADHQGTTQCLTDGVGSVTDSFAADAWGGTVKRTGNTVNPFWFAGSKGYERRQGNSDRLHVRARWLDSLQAVWLSRDPLELDAQPYAYVVNRPSYFIDPSGLACDDPGCCCCIQDLRWEGGFFSAVEGGFGHFFQVFARFDMRPGPPDDFCKLTWDEKTNQPYDPTGRGQPPPPDFKKDQWWDAFEHAYGSKTFANWRDATPDCPGDGQERSFPDFPSIAVSSGKDYRYLLIRITIESSVGCGCLGKRTLCFRQILRLFDGKPDEKGSSFGQVKCP